MTKTIENKGRERRKEKEGGRTMGEGTAKSVDEKVNVAECNSSRLEELSRRVAEVERRYLSDSRLAAYFLDHARACAAAGRRFSLYERCQWLRWYRPSDSKGRDVTVNNSDIAILARLIVERVPESEPFVEVRRSIYDPVFEARRASK